MTDSECKAIEQSCLENVRAALKWITSAGIYDNKGYLNEKGYKALEELEGLDLYWICDPAIKLAKSDTTVAAKSRLSEESRDFSKGDLISREDLKIAVDKQIAYCDDKSKHQSDLDEVLRYSNTAYGLRLAHICIDNAMAVYSERPKGAWKFFEEDPNDDDMTYYSCSVCGRLIHAKEAGLLKNYPFCHCGADMRKGAAE